MRVSTSLRRVLAVGSLSAAFVASAASFATPASATTKTVPGCFGVLVVYCDPTVEYVLPFSVGTTTMTVPVCAGTCTDVPVPDPTVSSVGNPRICVTANDRNGNQSLNTCAPIAAPRLVKCSSYYGETGYYVEDADGNMVLNGCVYTGDTPSPAVSLVTCYDGTRGVRVYDRNGSFDTRSCDWVNVTAL